MASTSRTKLYADLKALTDSFFEFYNKQSIEEDKNKESMKCFSIIENNLKIYEGYKNKFDEIKKNNPTLIFKCTDFFTLQEKLFKQIYESCEALYMFTKANSEKYSLKLSGISKEIVDSYESIKNKKEELLRSDKLEDKHIAKDYITYLDVMEKTKSTAEKYLPKNEECFSLKNQSLSNNPSPTSSSSTSSSSSGAKKHKKIADIAIEKKEEQKNEKHPHIKLAEKYKKEKLPHTKFADRFREKQNGFNNNTTYENKEGKEEEEIIYCNLKEFKE